MFREVRGLNQEPTAGKLSATVSLVGIALTGAADSKTDMESVRSVLWVGGGS